MTKRAGIRQKAGRVTNFDGYKEARVSEKNWPTTAGMGEGDIAMIHEAVEQRWPVDKERREPLATMLLDIALSREAKDDTKIQAARTVLTMEGQNQKDDLADQPKVHAHLHAHLGADTCRAIVLEAVDADTEAIDGELARRELAAEDSPEDNGRHRDNGEAAS